MIYIINILIVLGLCYLIYIKNAKLKIILEIYKSVYFFFLQENFSLCNLTLILQTVYDIARDLCFYSLRIYLFTINSKYLYIYKT